MNSLVPQSIFIENELMEATHLKKKKKTQIQNSTVN